MPAIFWQIGLTLKSVLHKVQKMHEIVFQTHTEYILFISGEEYDSEMTKSIAHPLGNDKFLITDVASPIYYFVILTLRQEGLILYSFS